MSGISAKAAGILQNKDKTFQGQKFDDDLGLNWVEFKYRNHDPQIGRFIEIDPLANDYVYNSTYAFSENKVTGHVELEGLECVNINNLVEKGIRQTSPSASDASVKQVMNSYDQGYLQGSQGATTGLKVAGITALMIFQPEVGFPLAVAEISGVPSPGAPTSMASTAFAETKALTNLEKNVATGKDFEQKVVANLSKKGNTNISEQVTITANNGINTRLDVVSRDANGKIVLTESKGSATAPLTKNQKIAHPSIEQSGGVVAGQGKPGFPGGTVIPPTKVDVVRPKNFWEY